MKTLKLTFMLVFTLLITVFPKTLRVPSEYATIQAAINSAQQSDTIIVSEGTYFENIDFRGKGILVASNYIFTNDWQTVKNTIINGSKPVNNDSASVVRFLNNEDSTAVIEGFTITGGSGTKYNFQSLNSTYQEGGGIMIGKSSPTVRDNIITQNMTKAVSVGVQNGGGGGISSCYGNPTIYNNLIISNTAAYACGIVLNWSSGKVRNNIIYHNTGGASYGCGGIMVWNVPGSSTWVENNTIVGNFSEQDGGGITISLATGSLPVIKNNIVWANSQQTGAEVTSSQSLQFNDIEDHLYTGNISINPLFSDSSFQLSNLSRCIDAGDSSVSCNDIADQNNLGKALFPSKGTIRNDLGAYGGEFAKLLPASDVGDICTTKKSYTMSFVKTGQNINLALDILNPGTLKLTVDSVTVINNSLFTLSPNSKGKTYNVFDRDTVFLNFKALKLGTVLDTIKIYHKALSTSSPIIIPVKISVTITGVEQEKPLQYNYKLYQNSPNPFSAGGRSASGGNPSTLIKFTIAKYEHVSLRVYDILGRNVETLIDSDMEKGEHELNWKPKASVSSGIYLVNISTGSFYDTKKIVYQK